MGLPATLLIELKVKSLSRVQLFATQWTVAHQASPSMGFSRQEYWSGLPLAFYKKRLEETGVLPSQSHSSAGTRPSDPAPPFHSRGSAFARGR